MEALLDAIPHRFENTRVQEAALGSALKTCMTALEEHGGQIIVFQSKMPVVGIGKIRGRPDESVLAGTEKEKSLFRPRDLTWPQIGEECALCGVAVNLVLTPDQYIDIGSLGMAVSLSGGDIFFHPRFNRARDELVLHSQLRRLIRRTQGYNCIMRVRCSSVPTTVISTKLHRRILNSVPWTRTKQFQLS